MALSCTSCSGREPGPAPQKLEKVTRPSHQRGCHPPAYRAPPVSSPVVCIDTGSWLQPQRCSGRKDRGVLAVGGPRRPFLPAPPDLSLVKRPAWPQPFAASLCVMLPRSSHPEPQLPSVWAGCHTRVGLAWGGSCVSCERRQVPLFFLSLFSF